PRTRLGSCSGWLRRRYRCICTEPVASFVRFSETTMPDAKGWMAHITREDPPELWERILHRAGATAIAANGLAKPSSVTMVTGTEAASARRERTTDTFSYDDVRDVKEAIVARGRERGFVTSEDLIEAVPVEDFTPEQVEEFLTQSHEHLT